jgi:hypothetical protein
MPTTPPPKAGAPEASEASPGSSKPTAKKSLREELIELGWKPLDPDEARRRRVKEIQDDVAAWEAAGRPPREEWAKVSPLLQRYARAAKVQPLDEWLKERRSKKK